MSLLSIEKLSFKEGSSTILSPMSFTFKSGVIGLIGPNGAGKSTLLKCLSNFVTNYEGIILTQNVNLKTLSHDKRANLMSYLPQSNAVSFPFLVSDVVEMGLYVERQTKSLSAHLVKERVLDALDKLEIGHLAARSMTQLSGGEKQLVHIARILVQNTKIILLDEPASSLDIGHEALLMNTLRSEATSGKCVVVALHNLNTAAEFCDKLLLLNKGELVEFGSTTAVLSEQHIQTLYGANIVMTTNEVTGNRNIVPSRWT